MSEDKPDNNQNEVEELVVSRIRKRRDAGRAKYGTSMERDDLTPKEWLVHAIEESLDHAIYLQKLVNMCDENGNLANN